MDKLKEPKLTGKQELFIDVLIARVRLGENIWTFDERFTKQAEELESLGLIGWKSHQIEGFILAWFTAKGKEIYLSYPYEIPLLKGYELVKKKTNK